jgi:hypothetical protein
VFGVDGSLFNVKESRMTLPHAIEASSFAD